MKKILENIANLIKVKTIVTIVVVVLFAVLAVQGVIAPEYVHDVTMMVIAFYFGTQAEKNGGK